MSHLPYRRLNAAAFAVIAAFSAACSGGASAVDPLAASAESRRKDDDNKGKKSDTYETTSVTPALVKSLVSGVEAFPVISSDDVLPGSPSFVFGGSADGAGLLRNSKGGYTMVVNHEDNFSISRVELDGDFKPVSGEYILNSTNGLFRLCSATLATPEEHGFGPLFLSAGESGPESQIHAVNPFGAPNSSRLLPALGQWSSENALPLPKYAYRGKTVIIIGDDDSGVDGGQVALYVGDRGDLDNGKLYVMARVDGDLVERNIKVGDKVPVEFKEVVGQRTLRAGGLNAEARALGALPLGRVEDLDYRKLPQGQSEYEGGDRRRSARPAYGREVWFNVTGQAVSGANADFSRTRNGRVYRLVLDERTPLKGMLEVVLDGDDRAGKAGTFQNVDNIYVGTNYAYIQEDANSYGDETHDAYIYQYEIATGKIRPVVELDHRRDEADAAKYNVGGRSGLGRWEYGAMIDVTETVGDRIFKGRGRRDEATFLVAIQPHSWTGERYQNADGGALRPNERQASQMILLRGLPR